MLSYLALSINVYLESAVFGVFRLAYGCLGPTEARIILIGCNTAIAVAAYAGDPPLALAQLANLAAVVLIVCMLGVLGVRFASNLRRLARMEPVARR